MPNACWYTLSGAQCLSIAYRKHLQKLLLLHFNYRAVVPNAATDYSKSSIKESWKSCEAVFNEFSLEKIFFLEETVQLFSCKT